MLASSRCIFTP